MTSDRLPPGSPSAAMPTPSPHIGVQPARRWGRLLVIVGILLLAAFGFALAHFWSPHADLRVTTGPPGGVAQRFMAAFVSVSAIQHPRVHLELVQVPDLAASG